MNHFFVIIFSYENLFSYSFSQLDIIIFVLVLVSKISLLLATGKRCICHLNEAKFG